MPHQLRIEEKPGHLHVRVSGENEPETIARYLTEIRAACARLKQPVVLVEENLTGPALSRLEIFGVASRSSLDAWPDVKRVAFVDTNPAHPFTNMKFAEDVAVNRGLEMRVFERVEEADRWLAERAQEA